MKMLAPKSLVLLVASIAATANSSEIDPTKEIVPNWNELVARGACNANNCNRAVTGTQRGPSATIQASSDCSSYLHTTYTSTVTPAVSTVYVTVPATVTLTNTDRATDTDTQTTFLTETAKTTITSNLVTVTTTVATVTVTLVPDKLKRAASPTIPTYATACSSVAAYTSACSCLGVQSSSTTITVTAPTPTVSSTVTVTGTSLATITITDTVTATKTEIATEIDTETATGTATVQATATCAASMLLTDTNNCGSCGFKCASGAACVNGACQQLGCSSLGQRCGSSSYCACFASTSDSSEYFCGDIHISSSCTAYLACNSQSTCGGKGSGYVCSQTGCGTVCLLSSAPMCVSSA